MTGQLQRRTGQCTGGGCGGCGTTVGLDGRSDGIAAVLNGR